MNDADIDGIGANAIAGFEMASAILVALGRRLGSDFVDETRGVLNERVTELRGAGSMDARARVGVVLDLLAQPFWEIQGAKPAE